jgi:hypothetical protein
MEGTFRARATEGAMGRAGTGTEQVAVAFELLDDEHKGQIYTWYGYFTPETMERTFEALSNAGWDGISGLHELRGLGSTEVSIVLKEDSYKGNKQTKVAFINKAGGLALKERLDVKEAQMFSKSMRANIANWKKTANLPKGTPATNGSKPAAAKKPPQRREEPPPADGDDIPF